MVRPHGDDSVGSGWSFSTTVSPLPLPGSLRGQLKESLNRTNRYVSSEQRWTIRRQLAEFHGLDPRQCLLLAGVGEALSLLQSKLSGKKLQVPVPGFTDYEDRLGAASRILRLEPVLSGGACLTRLDPEWADVIILSNPNNPTGSVVRRPDLLEIASRCEETDGWLIVDEAFVDLMDGKNPSLAGDVTDHRRLAVLRSLTKLYRSPGIRAGYLLGPKPLVEDLRRRQNPWPVSQPARVLLEQHPTLGDYRERVQSFVADEKTRLLEAVHRSAELEVLPGRANFLLIRGPEGIVEELAEAGFGVRNARGFTGLEPGWFRVRVASREANRKLAEELSGR